MTGDKCTKPQVRPDPLSGGQVGSSGKLDPRRHGRRRPGDKKPPPPKPQKPDSA